METLIFSTSDLLIGNRYGYNTLNLGAVKVVIVW